MREYPRGGILGKGIALTRFLSGFHIPVYAAHASFFVILSLFPLLVLLLGLLRYTGMSVTTLTNALEGLVPQVLMPAAKRLIVSAYRNTSGAVVSLSVVTALWSAGRGVYSLMAGLNVIYDTPENRGYFYTRGICTLYTFFFLIVLLLTLILHIMSVWLAERLAASDAFLARLITQITDLRVIVLLLVQTALFTAVYTILPNKKNRPADCFPGAVLSSVGWLVFSHLFSRYILYFPRYAHIYGSVYAVALGVLWLYFCISIVFYGGVLNRCLSDYQEKAQKN